MRYNKHFFIALKNTKWNFRLTGFEQLLKWHPLLIHAFIQPHSEGFHYSLGVIFSGIVAT